MNAYVQVLSYGAEISVTFYPGRAGLHSWMSGNRAKKNISHFTSDGYGSSRKLAVRALVRQMPVMVDTNPAGLEKWQSFGWGSGLGAETITGTFVRIPAYNRA
jgi:hypothetical protein